MLAGCGRIGFGAASDAAAVATEVLVAAGPFTMGCRVPNEADCRTIEDPVHVVTLSAFSIDQTEVTQLAYARCVTSGACTHPATDFDPDLTPDHPVRQVTWSQADAYCAFDGKRLPTEAEWEKAARGDDGRTYPWGEAAPTCDLAIFDLCAGAEPLPVGSRPSGRSPYGAFDMAGNVWEWTQDWFDPTYYTTSPTNDPQGPPNGTSRSVRGGYYGNTPRNVRTAGRASEDPMVPEAYLGFRCARSP
ncbi:MAG: uncharacterized protein JWP01_296 [Myxococcales bacterium]|nr:uncharacterized protein [Myxococcales bacterium]